MGGGARIRRTVLGDFGTDEFEDIVNNLEWGWITRSTAAAIRWRRVESAGDPDLPQGPGDSRFHLVTDAIEVAEGARGDFGKAFDDWANRFGSNSGNRAVQAVFPLRHAADRTEPPRLAAPILESDQVVFPIREPAPW